MQSLAKGCNLDWYSAPIMAPSVLPAQDDLGQGLDGEEVVNAQKILQHDSHSSPLHGRERDIASWHVHLDILLHLYSQYITPSFEGPQVMQQESLLLCLFISGSLILPSHAIHKVHVSDVLKSHIQAAAHTSSVGFCKRPLW